MAISKELLYNAIERYSYGVQQERDQFLSYISGETDTRPISVRNISIYMNQIDISYFDDPECAEMLRRMLLILSEDNFYAVYRLLSNNPDRYVIYKAAGLSDRFLKKEIHQKLYSYRGPQNFYSQNDLLYKEIKWIIHDCPDIVKELLSHCKTYQGEQQFTSLMLLAGYFKTLAEKKEPLPEKWESVLYSIMKKLYPGNKIKKAFELYADQLDSYEFVESCALLPLQMSRELIDKLLIIFSLLCNGLSPIGDDIIRISLILIDVRKIYDVLGHSGQEIAFMNNWRLPSVFSLRYWAFALLIVYRTNMSQYANQIMEIYHKDMEQFVYTAEELLQSKSQLAAPLVAAALQEAHPKALEWLSALEQVLVESLEDKQKRNQYCLVEKNGEEPDFTCLQRLNYTPPAEPASINIYENYMSELCMACIYIMPYSVVGANIVKSILLKVYSYVLSSIQLLSSYSLFCGKKGKPLFERVDEVHIPIELLLRSYIMDMYYNANANAEIEKDLISYLQSHKEQTEKSIETIQLDNDEMIQYLRILYEKNNIFDPKALLLAFNRRSKPVASYAEKLLATREAEIRPEVEALLQAKSKIASDAALRLIRLWDNNKIEEALKKLHTVEELADYVQKQYTKSNEKNVPFAKEIDYGSVRAKDTEEFLPEILLKYYVSEYILLKEIYFIKACKKIQEFANPYDLRAFVKRIYELWIGEGASVKYKNVLIPFALTAGDSQITELKKQIDFWSENSKPSLAAFAVQALCMNGSKIALLQADTMAKKHKNKKVRNAAQEAMELTAQEMGMSMEELNDLIIPDLGFNRNRERFFDYGKRQFKGILNDKLEILLYDPTGKAIKSLPKASAKFEDNEDMVTAAKEDLKAAKKQMKLIVDSQKPRMSRAIITKRTWTAEKWQALFVDNPIMSLFAMGLIWEECSQEGKLLQTFRYMEDGTFNTAEEEEHTLSENSLLCLLHPSDVEKEVVEAWKEQLSDYEIIQPVTQLDIPVYEITPENRDKKAIYDFQNKKVYASTFKSAANKLGMSLYFDSYGECAGCFFKDEATDITALLLTSSFYPGDFNSTTTIDAIEFKKGNLVTNRLELQLVPPRLLSFGMLAGQTITAKTVEE